jgi:hypothetical protein
MIPWRKFLGSLSMAVVAIATITFISRAFQKEFGQLGGLDTALPANGSVLKQSLVMSGTAEPGNRVKIYQEIGSAVVSDSGRFEYEWSGKREESENMVAIAEGDNQKISNLRISSENPNVLPHSPELGTSNVTYKFIAARGDLQEVSILGLDQVCSLYPAVDSEDVKLVEYWGIFQNRNISGVITFAECGSPQKDEFSGTFEEKSGCSGSVELIAMPDERNDLGKIEQATIVWQPILCEQTEKMSIAVVQRQNVQ